MNGTQIPFLCCSSVWQTLWSDSDCALMLQCVLSGKAQVAYSSLSTGDSRSYGKIKAAVLMAYELVPEAYQQRFRSWERKNGQTYVEFARDLDIHFKRWLAAQSVHTFDELCELMVLEQFRDALPGKLATYITERKFSAVSAVAAAADGFVLIHKG